MTTCDSTIPEAFRAIYETDAWSNGSGPGSRSVNTIEYRAFLERFLEANQVKRVTDLGCGDWQFSKQIDWAGVTYTGLDVVESVVIGNRARHARANIAFSLFTGIEDLPGGDLLLAKEVLQHLPTRIVKAYIAAIREKYRFALLTNSSEPGDLANSDVAAGGYRPLQLDEPPFDVPGARIFTYYPQSGCYLWKNVVYLVMGREAR